MSTSEQIKAEIEQLEKAVSPVMEQLDVLYREFSVALSAYVEAWMRKHVERRIEENADLVNSRGVAFLRPLKADLNALIGQLPAICAKAIGAKSSWPHRLSSTSGPLHEGRIRESPPAAAFREAICPVADLLEKYSLLKGQSSKSIEWESIPGRGYRYAINPGFEERHFSSLKQYHQLWIQLTKDIERIDEKKKELARASARELWGKA